MDVKRRTTAGFARGEVLLEGGSEGAGGGGGEGSGRRGLRILFQNENLVAREEGEEAQRGEAGETRGGGGRGAVLAAVPDLISCVEADSEYSAACRASQGRPRLVRAPRAHPQPPVCRAALQAACLSPLRR